MPQGMVRSLSKYLLLIVAVIDKWVIMVLNHSIPRARIRARGVDKVEFKQAYKGVKEQRVDDYSNSRNLDFVRCTLVAGKPVFGRKIHFYTNNYIIMHNIFKHYLHTTRSVLDP